MTKNGKIIADIVYASNDHLTAEQIFLKAKERSPKIVLATVYNNLNMLVSEGVIRRISIAGSPDRYDKPMRHDHLICDKCGRISDVTVEDMSGKLEKVIGTPILSYDLRIHYLCEECRRGEDLKDKSL